MSNEPIVVQCAKLNQQASDYDRPGCSLGFTVTEFLIVMVTIGVISAFAIPSVTNSWNAYRLSASASQVAAVLRQARTEAIRHNTTISCLILQQGNTWLFGVDVNKNGTIESAEPQALLPGPVQSLAAGVAPGPTSMGYPTAQIPSGSITFDNRGAVSYGSGSPTVYVIYLGMPGKNGYGYRAVTETPGGRTQVWGAAVNGSWHLY